MGGSASAPAAKGVKHIVMFGIKDDAAPEQVDSMKRCILGMPGKIPAIKQYEYGSDLLLPSGQSHPSGKNRAVSWSATFENEAAYEEYAKHPDHVNCIKNFIAPVILPGSRAAIQYRLG
eukprot:TRINITY_DN17106_c0_g1_i1.p1 TRINITY_DN17106_c0_g1~~TRINITY_DN17106_c0_g1_i1.p1  ORF type:complete len:135 (+),score=22.67 TRINITY_DN17106_c0_g1_i1:50-406(+)